MWLSSHRQAYGFSPLIYNKRNSSPTGWDSQLAKSLFQTHSGEAKSSCFSLFLQHKLLIFPNFFQILLSQCADRHTLPGNITDHHVFLCMKRHSAVVTAV